MTEFIRHSEYVRILDNKPEFTWIIPDEAIKQTAYQIDRNPPGSVRYQRIELIIKSQLTSYQLLLPPNKRNTAPGAVQLHDSIGVVIPFRAGEAEYARSLLIATHDRSWWNMIKSGSTITMEAWDMKYKPNSDWNHAWGAVPANIIPRFLWGIRPTKPGFAEVTIQPQPGNLTFSKIKFPTICGPIEATYKLTSNNNREYKIKIPAKFRKTKYYFNTLDFVTQISKYTLDFMTIFTYFYPDFVTNYI